MVNRNCGLLARVVFSTRRANAHLYDGRRVDWFSPRTDISTLDIASDARDSTFLLVFLCDQALARLLSKMEAHIVTVIEDC